MKPAIAAALFVLAAVAATGLALAQTRPATPAPARAPDPAIGVPPSSDTAKRLDRSVGEQALGGAECRTVCDRTYYLCLAAQDSDSCPTSWAQCLTACPKTSGNF